MRKKIGKDLKAAEFVEQLKEATDAARVAQLLRLAANSDIPQVSLKGAGARLPGYKYDKKEGRYLRQRAAEAAVGAAVVAQTLKDRAEAAFEPVSAQYGSTVDGRLLRSTADVRGVLRQVNSIASPAGRADLVRKGPFFSSVTLGSSNPKGDWSKLPNGNLGAASVADVLAKPFRIAPEQLPVAEISWAAYEEPITGTPLAVRTEHLLGVKHKGISAARTFNLYKDTVFALDSDMAEDLVAEPETLETTYQAGGKGMEDMIVPAAGFLVVKQSIAVAPR